MSSVPNVTRLWGASSETPTPTLTPIHETTPVIEEGVDESDHATDDALDSAKIDGFFEDEG